MKPPWWSCAATRSSRTSAAAAYWATRPRSSTGDPPGTTARPRGRACAWPWTRAHTKSTRPTTRGWRTVPASPGASRRWRRSSTPTRSAAPSWAATPLRWVGGDAKKCVYTGGFANEAASLRLEKVGVATPLRWVGRDAKKCVYTGGFANEAASLRLEKVGVATPLRWVGGDVKIYVCNGAFANGAASLRLEKVGVAVRGVRNGVWLCQSAEAEKECLCDPGKQLHRDG